MNAIAVALATLTLWFPAENDPSVVLNLWPTKPPGEAKELPPEADQTKPQDRLIAGRRIIKLGNVSTPQIATGRFELRSGCANGDGWRESDKGINDE